MAEAGVAGYEVYEWNVLFAPASTPDAVVTKLAAALQKTLDSPDVKARIAQLGGEVSHFVSPRVAQRIARHLGSNSKKKPATKR